MIVKTLRGTLSLVSIPSTPVTVVTLLIGYASVEGTILNSDIWRLIFVGALGHWGFYSMNDIMDYSWDYLDERDTKPLVSGDAPFTWAAIVCSMMLVMMIAFAIEYYPLSSVFTLFLASIFGALYNSRSKKDWFSGLYLSAWGSLIVSTGALYSGGFTGASIIISIIISVHMLWMTIIGDLKDIGKDEESIPERFDCELRNVDGYKYIWTSARFNSVASLILILEIIHLVLLPISDGLHLFDTVFVYIALIGGILIMLSSDKVLYQKQFTEDKMKKDIAKHELITVIAVIAVSISFMGLTSAVIIILGTSLWGLGWQTVLYGHPFRFP